MSLPASNPFSAPASLPYGYPDFASIDVAHIAPAIVEGFAEQRAQWEAVASDPTEPTVESVVVPLEESGDLLARVGSVFYSLASSVGGEELDRIEEEFSPKFAEHMDAFYLDRRIYDRLTALEGSAGELDEATAWLLTTYLKRFRRAGVELPDDQQGRLRELNAQIAGLEAGFGRRVVKAIDSHAPQVEDAELLEGLDEGHLDALRQDDGSYRIGLLSTTQQPITASLADAGMRARVLEASRTRNFGADPDTDTRQVVLDLARARAERAQLLGYAHHADYVAEDAAAGTSHAVMERLLEMAAPAARNATAEAAELAELMARDDPRPFTGSDWSYYSQKLRAEKFKLDDAALKPYLMLENVIERGVFFAANKLYGLTFTRREDIRGYCEDVKVWEVFDDAGTGIGLFAADYYARPGKRGGAWMSGYVEQSGLLGRRAVVTNDLNITKPPKDSPTLLTWDEARTCFHEFGHALHGLLSDVYWPSQSGTSVPRDFVEYPSQLNEMWLENAEVITNFARHHETDEVIPDRYVQTLLSLGAYGEGFATSEYLGAALLDQAWHRLTPAQVPSDVSEVERFEERTLREFGIDVVPPRYRTAYFNHTFGGGYDAGYYSYVWSEVLDADTADWFRTEAAVDGDGGLNRPAGARLRTEVLARGNSRDPKESFRVFRGREPEIAPLLTRRGLA